MVACLERTEGNADFHQIVDFLNASTIRYSLTISPTIYASYIEQFWATAKSKIVNNETQIHAKVDGKTIVILESSVRSNLHFNDEDGVTSLTNSKILENLALMGYEITQTPRQDKRGRDTKIPQSGGPPEKVGNAAVHKELGDIVEKAATTATSLDAEQDSGNILKTQSTTIPNVPLSQGIGIGGNPRCQEAMGGTIAQTRSERVHTPSYDSPLLGGNTPGSDEKILKQDDLTDFVPPTPHDSPLSGGHTPGSDKGRPNINELMAICTNLSNRVLALETSRTAQDLVIRKLKKKVRRLEKKLRTITPGMKLFKISTSKRKSLDKENVSKHGRNLKTRPIFKEGDFDDDIDDMVNEAMKNIEVDTVNVGGVVNTATTGVSAASAAVTTAGVYNTLCFQVIDDVDKPNIYF
ncbi:hypothetical protein Tco_0881445 [Tanacetum coccineum]